MSAFPARFNPDYNWLELTGGSPAISVESLQAREELVDWSARDLEFFFNRIAVLLIDTDRMPSDRALALALDWFELLMNRASKLGGWQRPHISSTEQGEIVLEWWRGERKLTIYFGDDGAEFLEVWGIDIDEDMSSGPLTNWSFSNAWLRLQS
jgi:hypothetical protein